MTPSRYHRVGRPSLVLGAATIVTLFAAAAFSGQSASAAATINVGPLTDSYVNSSAPSANYGTALELRIDGSPVVRSYLAFDLRSLSGPIVSATLRVYAGSASSGYEVHSMAGGWSEAGITYANAPSVGALVAKTAAFAGGTWTTTDVTSAVQAGALVSFGIVDPSATAVALGSRESANPPALVITLGGVGGTPAPTVPPTASPTATASSSPRPTPSATPTPPTSGSDPVLVGAGDICVTSTIGNATATAKLIEARPTAGVFTLGDNSNESGTASQYTGCYAKTWGAFQSRTHATIGNHDCMTGSGCAPYYAYFGAAAGPAAKGYYSYDLANNWHVIVLNSQGTEVGGTGAGSPQETWLRTDLAANSGKHIIAMWHIPVFTSGQLSRSAYDIWWQDLYAAHADLILDGHDHLYERFALQSPAGKADASGIREFIVGTGGASPQSFGATAANSQVRNAGTFGVLQLTLHAHSYDWQFIPIAGSTFTDSGTQATHS
jgi:acid phosphatase type 7